MEKITLSFVIPCYRSEKTISGVIQEITCKMAEHPELSYEIITVNDHSPDRLLDVLTAIARDDRRVKVVDMSRNMGQHAAIMAGYSVCSGQVIVNLDDDGQCPLDRLWDLLEPLGNGYDIAMARYRVKRQSVFKNLGSRVNNLMANFLLNKPKNLSLSNFTAMKRFVLDEILRYPNPYPYVDGLMLRTTEDIVNVDMEDRPRTHGKTGYTFKKAFSLWMNGFTAFSVKPLRIATLAGTLCAALGFLYGGFTIIRKLIAPDVPAGYSSIMAALLFIGGVIMLLLGMIGEYVGRIYISINRSPQYVIRATKNLEEDAYAQRLHRKI